MRRLSLIVCILSTASAAWSAIAYVNTANGSNDASGATIATGVGSITTGNLLACTIFWTGAGTISGVAGTGGNTFAQASGAFFHSSSNDNVDVWYIENVTGASNFASTATFSVAQTFRRIICNQYSGVATAGSIDISTNQITTAGTSVSATLITTTANDLIVAGVTSSVSQTYTQGTGFTLRSTVQGTDTQSEDEITTTAGSYAVAISGNSGRLIMTAASFKPAAVATTVNCPSMNLLGVGCMQ